MLTPSWFQFHLVRLKAKGGTQGRSQLLLFQFHLVRLKASSSSIAFNQSSVSIPFSTIKRCGQVGRNARGLSFNSI